MNQTGVEASFSTRVLEALQLIQRPTELGQKSPLAAPYFLGAHLTSAQTDGHDQASARGMALRTLISHSLQSLSERHAEGPYYRRLLEASFFERTRVDGVWDELGRSKPQYYRDRKVAVELLSEEIVRRVHPSLRLERPTATSGITGRESDIERCRREVTAGRSVGIVGPSGIGKTTLAAHAVAEPAERPLLWYTFHTGINDNLGSVLFALAYFLHLHGNSDLWLQLVADSGEIRYDTLLGLLHHSLEDIAVRKPVLCFDDVDLLQPEIDAHAQILSMFEGLAKSAAILYIGQRLDIVVDVTIPLDQLSHASIRELLLARGVHLRLEAIERLAQFTGGNPRLLSLYMALVVIGEDMESLLATLAHAPSLEAVLNRVWRRLNDDQQHILAFLSVFRRPAPSDYWTTYQDRVAIQALIDLDLVQNDGKGALSVLPIYIRTLYKELMPETRDMLHGEAAAVRAARGQYTAAVYHLIRSGRPELAVRLWYRVRQMEIDQGQAGAALLRFNELSQNQLSEHGDRERLALIRSELFLLQGEYGAARATIRSTEWLTPVLQVKASRIDGDISELQGDLQAAASSYLQGLTLVEESLEQELILFHRDLGWIGRRQRSYADALAHAQLGAFEIEMLWGHIKKDTGELVDARLHYEAAVDKARVLRSLQSEAKACNALAFVLAKQGQFDSAERHFERAYELFKQIGKYFSLASVRHNQAVARLLREEPEAVIPLATEAQTVFARLSHPYGVATSHQVMAEAYLAIGDLEQAHSHASLAIDCEETTVIPDALRVLGEVQHRRGVFAKAQQIIQQSVDAARENNDKYLEAYAWRSLAAVYADDRQVHQAQAAITKAVELFKEMELPQELARCHKLKEALETTVQ